MNSKYLRENMKQHTSIRNMTFSDVLIADNILMAAFNKKSSLQESLRRYLSIQSRGWRIAEFKQGERILIVRKKDL